jgi:exodeoxyribonuclease-3
MKLVSFNVNGIRAAINKGLLEWLEKEQPDVLCLQEIKAHPEQIPVLDFEALGYKAHINSAEKRGYSGVAVFSKIEPKSVSCNFDEYFDNKIFTDDYGDMTKEGRIIAVEFDNFYLINTYVPNAKNDLSRLEIRHDVWDKKLLKYIQILEKTKSVVICGDMNVAHQAIDLANPKQNEKNAGFTKEEREGFENLMQHGLIDIFRHFYPNKIQYTWWSMRLKARERNIGWRIDYFLCSHSFINKIESIEILDQIAMSDHCPVEVKIKN